MKASLFILIGLFLGSCEGGPSDQAKLIVAVTNNQPLKVKELIASPNVNINAINDETGPVLCLAAYVGSDEIIKILLKNGADVNIRDGRGTTPLMNAVLREHESTVELLLDNGADVSASISLTNQNGEPTSMTAMSIALMRGNGKITNLLENARK